MISTSAPALAWCTQYTVSESCSAFAYAIQLVQRKRLADVDSGAARLSPAITRQLAAPCASCDGRASCVVRCVSSLSLSFGVWPVAVVIAMSSGEQRWRWRVAVYRGYEKEASRQADLGPHTRLRHAARS
jgi:hypothetical protein